MRSADQIAEAVIEVLLADEDLDLEVVDVDVPLDGGDVWYPQVRVVELYERLAGENGEAAEQRVIDLLARLIARGDAGSDDRPARRGIVQRWPGQRVWLWRNHEGVYQHQPPSDPYRHQVIWTEIAGGVPSYQHYWLSFQIAAAPT